MAKIQLDLQKAMDKSALEREKLSQQERLEEAKLGARIAEDNSREQLESKRIASKEQIEGAKLGKEIAKDLMNDKNSEGKPS
jgi:hypothetical protein